MAVKTLSKSDAIRKILAKHSSASVKEIGAALKEQGVKASTALINKIKYGQGRTKKGHRGRKGVSKAEAIRQAWSELGAHARPRDVIESLAKKGVRVSSAQVSLLRTSNGKPRKLAAAHSLSIEHLLAAKILVGKVGSIKLARQAVANLAKLVEA